MTSRQAPSPARLRVHEIFTSLQGETTAAGFPFLFIRLAGCPLHCRWCDTFHAQDRDHGTWFSLDEILARVTASRFSRVLVTGGEPLAQPETPALLQRLLTTGRQISLETGGAHPLSPVPAEIRLILDWKPPSAAAAMPFRTENLAFLKPDDEMKIVVDDETDLDFAFRCDEEHDLSRRCLLSFSPTPRFIASGCDLPERILASGRDIRINYQLHKHFFRDPGRNV